MMALDNAKLLCTDETLNLKEVFEQTESGILSVTVAERKQEDTDIKSIVHGYVDVVEDRMKQTEQGIQMRLPTGYPSVDRIIKGSGRGELTVIAGPAKLGKSTFNLGVARNRAKGGARVVIFSGEMTHDALVQKFVSMETGIPVDTLIDATFTPQQWALFVEASNRISTWPMHIIDEYSSPTPLDIRRELRRIMHKEHVDCVLIDGLWLMRSDAPTGTEHLDYENIMKALAATAKNLNIPIDLVHQMNRQPGGRKDKRPMLSDFGKSIGVEQNATKCIFLHRNSYYQQGESENETDIIVAANRYGKTGTATLGFDVDSERYHELKSTNQHYTAPRTDYEPTERKDIHQ